MYPVHQPETKKLSPNNLFALLIILISLIMLIGASVVYRLYNVQTPKRQVTQAKPSPTSLPQPSPIINLVKTTAKGINVLTGVRQQFTLPIKDFNHYRYSFQWEAYVDSSTPEEGSKNFYLPVHIVKQPISDLDQKYIIDIPISNATHNGRPNIHFITNPPNSPYIFIVQNRDGSDGRIPSFINIETGEVIPYHQMIEIDPDACRFLPVNKQTQEQLVLVCVKEQSDTYHNTSKILSQRINIFNITTRENHTLLTLNEQETFTCKDEYDNIYDFSYVSPNSFKISVCEISDNQVPGKIIRQETFRIN